MCAYISEVFLRFIFYIPVEEDSAQACYRSPASTWAAEDAGGPAVPCRGGNEHEAAGQH